MSIPYSQNKVHIENTRKKQAGLGFGKLEIIGVTEKDKQSFRNFKKTSGIDKNSDAFRKLLEIASLNDNQKYFII